MAYLEPDIIDDEGAAAQGILGALADSIDGFEPAEGSITTPLAESVAIAIATAVTVLKDTALDSYMGFGEAILDIPRIPAGVATVQSTWTFADATGFTVPSGTEVQASKPDGSEVIFTTADTTTVTDGTTTVSHVELVAVESGPDSNGAAGTATAAAVISDSGNTVVSVALDGASAGGADQEDPDVYAGRLAQNARRLHTLPILPADYAALALNVPPYYAAVALNRFDPADPSTDSPGHLTIVGRDSAGRAVDSNAKQALLGYFNAMELPLNVVIHALDPGFVSFSADVNITVADGADPDAVTAAAEAAITALLDPANFDIDPDAPGRWASPQTRQLTVFDLAAAVDDLTDLGAVTGVTITPDGGSAQTSVDLPAPVSLPDLSSVTVTA